MTGGWFSVTGLPHIFLPIHMPDQIQQNLLDYIPIKNIEWEINSENQLIVLKKPKFENSFLRKHLLPLLKDPNFKIKLDKYGSHVWQKIDGRYNVMQIADSLKQEFGPAVEPVYERVGKFILSLEKSKFISYINQPEDHT